MYKVSASSIEFGDEHFPRPGAIALPETLSYWPAPGPIDLEQHDPPHPGAETEWWYVHAHLLLDDGRELGMFAAFFRVIAAADEETGETTHAHSMTWAISDTEARSYLFESRVDQMAPRVGRKRIRSGIGTKDESLNRAMLEILDRDQIPTPDRVFDGPVRVATDSLDLDFGGARFKKLDDGRYRLSLPIGDGGAGCDLVFEPKREPIRHGDDGAVRGSGGEQMFYYFVPRCVVAGTVTTGGVEADVAEGSGWYDHEFGGRQPGQPRSGNGATAAIEDAGFLSLAWNWVGIQLEDGTDLTAFDIVDPEDKASGASVGKWLVVVDPDGNRISAEDVTFTPGRRWTSTRTFHRYPTTWRLQAPSIDLDLSVEAFFDDQELITVIAKPAFWEGRCKVSGSFGGREVAGQAYLERTGFEEFNTLDEFFAAVGKEARSSLSAMLPLKPSRTELRDLIASADREHYLDGVDLSQLASTLIAPIREIVDRGGKAWRSFAASACCDVVGGDSRQFVRWLGMPELLHVGSLIVDDVEDHSRVRRGGPACHLIYGEAIAINAGTGAYFLTQNLLKSDALTAETKLQIYDLYFEVMRAGHAGQAIDLGGMADLMPAVVETGDTKELEARILASYRLKTGAAVGGVARMGALAGRGTTEQVSALGELFEKLGIAFQIVDDILNLRGFKGDRKDRGEDVTNGTVTLPIATAMRDLPHDKRAWLWTTLQARPTDVETIAAVIELVENAGAMEASEARASEMIETAWQSVEPLLEPSLARVLLRAFGWYILDRRY